MPRNGQRQRAKAWCFTLNNYNREEEVAIKAWLNRAEGPSASYLVFGREVGENGTPHLQGYVEFASKVSLSSIRQLNGRIHWERRRGTSSQASDYCKKDGDFFEAGSRSTPGRRSDLDAIRLAIAQGKSETWVAENHFSQWCVYRRSFAVYRQLINRRRSWKSYVNVIWGTTGVGKTRFVFQQHPDDDIYVWGGDRWFDGYTGQSVALLDDYRGELDIGLLLRLLDRYPMQVPVKGSFVEWLPRRIYITSNLPPDLWYGTIIPESLAALERRLDRVDHVTENIFED